jgi:hypothetical protein
MHPPVPLILCASDLTSILQYEDAKPTFDLFAAAHAQGNVQCLEHADNILFLIWSGEIDQDTKSAVTATMVPCQLHNRQC